MASFGIEQKIVYPGINDNIATIDSTISPWKISKQMKQNGITDDLAWNARNFSLHFFDFAFAFPSVSFESNKFNVGLSLIFKFQSHHHHQQQHDDDGGQQEYHHWFFFLLFVIYLVCSALWFHHSVCLSWKTYYQGESVLFSFQHLTKKEK